MLQESSDEIRYESLPIKKTSVLLMILLTLLTCGIYTPVWFFIRRKEINRLQSAQKLNVTTIILITALHSLNILLAFIAGINEELGNLAISSSVDQVCRFLDLAVCISVIYLAFSVRYIFIEHFNKHLQLTIPFSGAATFFFSIFYLQYKINRFEYNTPQYRKYVGT